MERVTHVKHSWGIAVRALRKNRLQTALTMTGMTIGVATVLTMIALGAGAESSIQDQVRAAGMNLIIVTAGNWNRGDASGGASMSSNRPAPRPLCFARLLQWEIPCHRLRSPQRAALASRPGRRLLTPPRCTGTTPPCSRRAVLETCCLGVALRRR